MKTIGPVTSMVPFYEALGIKPGDKMYRPDSARASVW
jgi:putative endopeptidase